MIQNLRSKLRSNRQKTYYSFSHESSSHCQSAAATHSQMCESQASKAPVIQQGAGLPVTNMLGITNVGICGCHFMMGAFVAGALRWGHMWAHNWGISGYCTIVKIKAATIGCRLFQYNCVSSSRNLHTPNYKDRLLGTQQR